VLAADSPEGTAIGEHDRTNATGHCRVDTHLDLHVAAVLDHTGRLCGTQEFPASTRGDVALVTWAIRTSGAHRRGRHRHLRSWLTRLARRWSGDRRGGPAGRSLRRRRGKSDPIDAQAAARATQAGVAAIAPKTREVRSR
jgi:transposase